MLFRSYLKEMPPIVPILIGTDDLTALKEMALALHPYFNDKNLFVISCDFSHYPSYEDANMTDERTAEAILTGDIAILRDTLQKNSLRFNNLATSACGHSAIELLLMLIAKHPSLKITHIEYRNSGDSIYGDKERVVGYHSFIVSQQSNEKEFLLSTNEKSTLLNIARQTIANQLNKTNFPVYQPGDITETLKRHCGAFVTLHGHGKLS